MSPIISENKQISSVIISFISSGAQVIDNEFDSHYVLKLFCTRSLLTIIYFIVDLNFYPSSQVGGVYY